MDQTQAETIIKHIDTHGSITSFEAFSEYNITRLAARIHDIEQMGIVIDREMVYTKNSSGHPVRYMRYWRAS